MRKDRIEERICGIERDVKELRSEIRQELRSMMAELKEFQELMIDGRVGDIQDALSRQYSQAAYEEGIAEARQTFEDRMCHDCPPGSTREKCIDHFVNKHLRACVNEIESSSPESVDQTMKQIADRDARDMENEKGTVCEPCYYIYNEERDRLLSMGEKFVRYRESMRSRSAGLYFRQLPDDLAVSEIVEPLSHKARFAMLKSLTSGGRSYKELGEITGYTGGHLLYHVNKLTTTGLIAKEESNGQYVITEKGMGVMEVVKKMYAK
jgi:DNA-binding HxlR family transcriptional regulator